MCDKPIEWYKSESLVNERGLCTCYSKTTYEIRYMSDGDPFSPKYETITMGDDGPQSRGLTEEKLIEACKILFGGYRSINTYLTITRYTTRKYSDGVEEIVKQKLKLD